MADLKISQLTGAATPLAGTEVLPIVQSATTKKVAVSDLTAGRDVSVKNLSATGSLQIGTNGTYAVGTVYSDNNWGMLFTAAKSSPVQADYGWLDYAGNELFRIQSGNLRVMTAAKGVNFTANTPAAGMTSQLLNWYEEGTWTPTISGTWSNVGTPTLTGTYTRIGRQVTVFLKIVPGTSISATRPSSTISGVPFGPIAGGVAGGTQVDDNAQGYVSPAMAPNGTIYVQTTGILTVALYISVTYFV